MKKAREEYIGRLVLSFILANLIFLIVIGFTSSILQWNYQGITDRTSIIQQSLEEMENILQFSSLDCTDDTLVQASEILDIVGGKISILETRFGKTDSRVLEQKKTYNELELKHFRLIKKIEETCGKEFIKVFFFYSNSDDLEGESERMGFILSSFKNNAPDKVMIYSFDYDLNSEIIKDLKQKHEIPSAPRIVINEKEILYVRNIDELEVYLPNQ